MLSKAVEPVILGPTNIVAAAPITDSTPPTEYAAIPSTALPIVEFIKPGATAFPTILNRVTIPAPARILFTVLPVFNLNANRSIGLIVDLKAF